MSMKIMLQLQVSTQVNTKTAVSTNYLHLTSDSESLSWYLHVIAFTILRGNIDRMQCGG